MGFKSLIPPSTIRHSRQKAGSNRALGLIRIGTVIMLRDSLSLSSWLAVGGILQSILFLAFGRLALLPPVILMLYRFANAYLQACGIIANPHMKGVLHTRHTAQVPASDGTFGDEPANGDIVVFNIGTKTNHPMGALAPGFKEVGDYFAKMSKSLELRAAEFGYLGGSQWMATERATCNESLFVMYFKSVAGLHAFAHDPIHREGWNWWNRTIKDHPYITIYHELFESKAKSWETVYINRSARSLLAGTSFDVTDEHGRKQWVSPVVEVPSRLTPSIRRMGRGPAAKDSTLDEKDSETVSQYTDEKQAV